VLGKGGFPGTVVPKDCHKFPRLYPQVHLVQSRGNHFHIAFLVTPEIFMY